MLIRPRLFLTFLGVCLVPLVLLASVNYWTSLREARTSLQKSQEDDLANFKSRVSDFLTEDRNELIKLTRSKPLLDYVSIKNEGKTNPTVPHLANTSSTRDLITRAETSGVVPTGLREMVASVLNSRSHFGSIFVFGRNRQPLFWTEQHANNTAEPVAFHTQDFLSQQPHPDDRVWTARAATVLNSPVSTGPLGARVDCAVPIVAEQQDGDPPQGALLGELKLDPIFSEAAKELKSSSRVAFDRKDIPNVVIVLDRSGRILYHSNEALKHQFVSNSIPYFQSVARQMFSNQNGHETFTLPQGGPYTTTYTRIPDLDLSVAVAANSETALAAAHRAGRIGLAVAVLLAVLSGGLLAFSWQRKARGIERVAEGVEAIAKGELDHHIDVRSSDDLRPLADNVGLMTQQLREQIAREAETRQFQSFVRLSAILTHDLKNAIEALSLIVTNMERHFDNEEFRADAMKSLTGATEKLRALVARLSNPVNTLSGEHKRPRPVDLVPMLKRVISMTAEPVRGEHQIRIKLPESLFALVDVERMDKVVENLVINALEAMTGKSGTVTIEAGKLDTGRVFFSVSDTGEGMSRRFIDEKLFRPFATTKKKGVGLGLYTCREVVRANGGAIEVESQEGAGTSFRVVLPSAAMTDAVKNGRTPLPQ